MKRLLILLALLSGAAPALTAQSHTVVSPGAVHAITFELIEGIPTYRVDRLGRPVIGTSRLGFTIKDQEPFDRGFRIVSVGRDSLDQTWEQVWGEQRHIRNHYRELRVALEDSAARRRMDVVFRAYDDGIAFRYEFPRQSALGAFLIMDEHTEFALPHAEARTWSIDAYQWNRFEYYYDERPLAALDTVHTPLTLVRPDGLHLSFHEAALVDWSTMTLERTHGSTFKANLMPWSDGVRVRTAAPARSPWRTVQISDDAAGLIESYLILNLNEPNKIEDTSWIEPGKYVGIWWEMHLDKSTWSIGPKHGATTANAKRYIDFAAANGFDQVLVEGWNTGWEGEWYRAGAVFDFTKAYPDFDLEEVARYARSKGVRLMGHHETSAAVEHYESQMEAAFALYQRNGVRSVKTGYVGHGTDIRRTDESGVKHPEWHHGQFMVRHHQRVVETAAKYGISLNVHEGLKDTGLRRTWPNLMTREVAIGQEYNAWGGDGGHPPSHTVTLPFTRNLAGPFDYTPGVLQLTFEPYRPQNRVKSTISKELALYVVLYSPLQMAADLPENYLRHAEAFRFIREVPTDWHETRVLNGEIGDYVTIARRDRNSERWFLGSITDENGRLLRIDLSFLDPGRRYRATVWRDGDRADWITNPYDQVIETREVRGGDRWTLRLAPAGGQAVVFEPID